MEIWIVVALVAVVVTLGAYNRYVRRRKAEAEGRAKDIYPLW